MATADHAWFQQRSYCHFDRPLKAEQAESLVVSPEAVAQHAFSPLIWRNKTVRVWKRRLGTQVDSDGGPQPVSGPRPAQRAQEKILRARETAGEKTNRGHWEPKKRPLAYASHADAAIYSYYHMLVRDRYEAKLRELGVSDAAIAYRYMPREFSDKGKSSFHFAAEAFASIEQIGECKAHCLDIKGFFDNIPHELLKTQYRRVFGTERIPDDHYRVLNSVINASRIPLNALRRHLGVSKRAYEKMRVTRAPFQLGAGGLSGLAKAGLLEKLGGIKGIPQGLPVSGLYANIAMLAIDCELFKQAAATGCVYRRYSDDVLVFGPPEAADCLAARARELIVAQGFEVPAKKATTHKFSKTSDPYTLVVDKPLVYLGLEYDGKHVRLKSQTVVRLEKRAKRCVDCMARAAVRIHVNRGHATAIRLNRRRIYSLFSPLPFKGTAKERKEWRGDFTDYARHAQQAVEAAFGRSGVSTITRQLHPRMERLKAYIKMVELDANERLKRLTRR